MSLKHEPPYPFDFPKAGLPTGAQGTRCRRSCCPPSSPPRSSGSPSADEWFDGLEMKFLGWGGVGALGVSFRVEGLRGLSVEGCGVQVLGLEGLRVGSSGLCAGV